MGSAGDLTAASLALVSLAAPALALHERAARVDCVLLAQSLPSGAGGRSVLPSVLWLAAIAGLALAGFLALSWLRRRLLGNDANEAPSDLTLDTLRAMKARGELSDAEFAAAKSVVVAQARRESQGPQTRGLSKGALMVEGERRALPGFDLTGEPLPKPDPPDKHPP